ncbi:MAG: hypothetical protein NWF00_01095 [Candidatus Bathyarchaeota archaeon]|nr:hypothetical protein [Candidatus Bathyarchaeota archaeon]
MSGAISREVVSEIQVLNADGGKTALVVYQPGFSSFPKDLSYAFAEGLASSGWRVEITTASSQVPSDLVDYGLLVLAYPVYGGTPGTAIVKYVNNSNLNGLNTVIIACAGSDSGESITPLKQQVPKRKRHILLIIGFVQRSRLFHRKCPTNRRRYHTLKQTLPVTALHMPFFGIILASDFCIYRKSSCCCFQFVDGRVDYAGFFGDALAFLNWAKDLFLYYWNREKRA